MKKRNGTIKKFKKIKGRSFIQSAWIFLELCWLVLMTILMAYVVLKVFLFGKNLSSFQLIVILVSLGGVIFLWGDCLSKLRLNFFKTGKRKTSN